MDNFDTPQNCILLAIVLIAAGALLLAVQFYGNFANVLWPFFVIVPGAGMLAIAGRGQGRAGLGAAGAVVATVGLVLLVQSATDYYRSWAYAWALLPLSAGAALFYFGGLRGDDSERRRGRWIMQWSALAFIGFGALFELVLFDGGNVWGRYVVPLVLIAAGAVMLLRRPARNDSDREPGPNGRD